MDLPLTRNDLKVDATVLQQTSDSWLALFNVNVPAKFVDGSNPTLFNNACQKIINFVDNFIIYNHNEQVLFQITATYYIVNEKTGMQRLWGGSFSPRENIVGQLAQFREYNPKTFTNFVLTSCENFDIKLTWIGKNTVWKFDSLESIIINIQTPILAINNKNPVLQRYGLVIPDGGHYIKKRIVTFKLP